jgi:hypothetical protein
MHSTLRWRRALRCERDPDGELAELFAHDEGAAGLVSLIRDVLRSDARRWWRRRIPPQHSGSPDVPATVGESKRAAATSDASDTVHAA